MSEAISIRLPEINGSTESEQLRQVRSYLYQLAEQLQFALNSADAAPAQAETAPAAMAGGESPASVFSSLKSLIIKSADIVDAYYEEVSRRLEGVYVAQSDFGTFSQQTAQEIAENADGILQSFENIQQLSETLEAVHSRLLDVSAYIKTGLLYYDSDSVPVYGVEIGQEEQRDGVLEFRKYTRLTPEKLAFFDSSDNEVAYISDRKLHIVGAEIHQLAAESAEISRLRIGGYTWHLGADGHLTLA